MSQRLPSTRIDDLIVIVNPILIMILVGSLLLFMLEAFYQGQFDGRLRVILMLFTLAIVLIARIAAEQGRQYSVMFALPLAAVTALAITRLVQFQGPLSGFSVPINFGLMALIWWAADRLTWDCTIADQSRAPAGEGLLMNVGLDPVTEREEGSSPTDRSAPAPRTDVSLAAIGRALFGRHKEHRPGLWVLLFSLAALPIFGIGQIFTGPEAQSRVFSLMLLYVASGFGLLMTTSLLGLRRYLRERRIEMSDTMAVSWLVTGTAAVVVLLVVCLLLPRRGPSRQVAYRVASDYGRYDTSDHAVGDDGRQLDDRSRRQAADPSARTDDDTRSRQATDDDTGRGGRQQGDSGSAGDESSARDASNGQSSEADKSDSGRQGRDGQRQGDDANNASDPSNGERRPTGEDSTRRQQDRESSSARQGDEEPNEGGQDQRQDDSSDHGASDQRQGSSGSARGTATETARAPNMPVRGLGDAVAAALKWIYWVVVILVVGYLVVRYHRQVLQAIQDFLESIRLFWQQLLSGGASDKEKESEGDEATPGVQAARVRSFSEFSNPFETGAARDWDRARLIAYSFEALEAWARENSLARDRQQTPDEFASSLTRAKLSFGEQAVRLVRWYTLASYARGQLPQRCVDDARRFWDGLSKAAVQPIADRSAGDSSLTMRNASHQ